MFLEFDDEHKVHCVKQKQNAALDDAEDSDEASHVLQTVEDLEREGNRDDVTTEHDAIEGGLTSEHSRQFDSSCLFLFVGLVQCFGQYETDQAGQVRENYQEQSEVVVFGEVRIQTQSFDLQRRKGIFEAILR